MKTREITRILLELCGVILLILVSTFILIFTLIINHISLIIITLVFFILTVYHLIKIIPDIIRLKKYIRGK